MQSLRVKENIRIDLLKQSYDKKALGTVEAELSALEAQYQQVQQTIRARYPAYQQMMHPDAVTLREIQMRVLGDDQSLLLEYALGKERSYLWVVSHSEFQSYELPGKHEIEDVSSQSLRFTDGASARDRGKRLPIDKRGRARPKKCFRTKLSS